MAGVPLATLSRQETLGCVRQLPVSQCRTMTGDRLSSYSIRL
ncbi:MAG: hypothetical protein N6V49_00185 [Serratia symbiotica]|nr:hypothetical protein [Serratia symbiotica]